MMTVIRPLVLAVAVATALVPGRSFAQAEPAAAVADEEHDCSRWPASVYDAARGACVCPAGKWWNVRGDACLPREHAAHEFCSMMWPSSDPYFVAGGGYRCVCPPPLVWNAEATACRPVPPIGVEECAREWPGTLPVLSPSGTEFDCRCPSGRRWDEPSRSCVDGAPAVPAPRGFFPQEEGAAPSPGTPGSVPLPPVEAPGAVALPPADSGAAYVPPVESVPSNPRCEALLGEIRARAAAGQADQADALGMKAAVAGCSPSDIADAARVPTAPR
jgi:hypothetical protein